MDNKIKVDNKMKVIKEMCERINGKENITTSDVVDLLRELITPLDEESKVNDGILMTLYAIVNPMLNYNTPDVLFKKSGVVEICGTTITMNYFKGKPEVMVENKDRRVVFRNGGSKVSGLVFEKKHKDTEYGEYYFEAYYFDTGLLKSSNYSVRTIPLKSPYPYDKFNFGGKSKELVVSFTYDPDLINVNGNEGSLEYKGLSSKVVPFIPYVAEASKEEFDSVLESQFPILTRRVKYRMEDIMKELVASIIKSDREAFGLRERWSSDYLCGFNGRGVIVKAKEKPGIFEGVNIIDDDFNTCHVKAKETDDYSLALVHSNNKMGCKLVSNSGVIKMAFELVASKKNPHVKFAVLATDEDPVKDTMSLNDSSNDEILRNIHNIACSNNNPFRNDAWLMIAPEIRKCLNSYTLSKGKQKSMGEKKN